MGKKLKCLINKNILESLVGKRKLTCKIYFSVPSEIIQLGLRNKKIIKTPSVWISFLLGNPVLLFASDTFSVTLLEWPTS